MDVSPLMKRSQSADLLTSRLYPSHIRKLTPGWKPHKSPQKRSDEAFFSNTIGIRTAETDQAAIFNSKESKLLFHDRAVASAASPTSMRQASLTLANKSVASEVSDCALALTFQGTNN